MFPLFSLASFYFFFHVFTSPGDLRRKASCAAYNAVVAVLTATQKEEKFYLKYCVNQKPAVIWNNIVDTKRCALVGRVLLATAISSWHCLACLFVLVVALGVTFSFFLTFLATGRTLLKRSCPRPWLYVLAGSTSYAEAPTAGRHVVPTSRRSCWLVAA